MLIRQKPDIAASEITPRHLFEGRRDFIRAAGVGIALASATGAGILLRPAPALAGTKLPALRRSPLSATEAANSQADITSYNNFYEFGTGKEDPGQNAHTLRTRPWTLAIEGEVKHAKVYDLDELLKLAPLEERIYRLRCVEGWSMVIPWAGYPLSELIRRAEPTGRAHFVEFISAADPEQMPGVRRPVLEWPYAEGLRLDEAMHPLALLTLGLYGEVLPNQNGAPVRVTLPWKYGFKSAKSLVKIRLVERQPRTTWSSAAPREYGFYSNVNPQVDHPRWSQARERRIGELGKRATLPFNGYADQVAALYTGMDLRANF